jgi:hypothetical protein
MSPSFKPRKNSVKKSVKKSLKKSVKKSSKPHRDSPSDHANDNCMQTKMGNDGKLYMSLPNKNMVCRWVKVPKSVKNTDELYYKAVKMLGPKWKTFEKTKVRSVKMPKKSKPRKIRRHFKRSTRSRSR